MVFPITNLLNLRVVIGVFCPGSLDPMVLSTHFETVPSVAGSLNIF